MQGGTCVGKTMEILTRNETILRNNNKWIDKTAIFVFENINIIGITDN